MNKVNILVVDDRPEGILAIEAVLKSPAYNIITASSGNEALKHLLQNDFAVILMDVQMPVMNGFETASVIKTREKSRDIPIIFMSAINQDEQYVYQGYGVGAIDYLLKPFDPYILKSKVSIFADIYRKNQLIKEQAQKLLDAEAKEHSQKLDRLEIENLRRYQYLADAIPQIVFRLLPDGQYEYFNKVWFDYTGLSLRDSYGLAWKDVIHPEDVNKLTELFNERINQNGMECECRILNKNRIYRWHLIQVRPEKYFHPEEVNSWLGTALDVEDRKKNSDKQQFLAKAGELLVATLDYHKTLESITKLAVPYLADWCAIDIVNEEGKLTTISFSHQDPKLLDEASAFYQKHFQDNSNDFGLTALMKQRSARILNQEEISGVSALILPLEFNGEVIGVMTFVRQQSQVKYDQYFMEVAQELSRRVILAFENARLYTMAQEAIEIRNDFLSIASHELNTPITSLKLQLQMVRKSIQMSKDGVFPVERFTKSVEASVKQVDRLINLIQILLDVSRIQSGKFNFSFEKFEIHELVTEVMDRHKEILMNSNCSLEFKNGSDIDVVWDKVRIEQVLTNLITNAIKYAPGRIEFIISEEERQVVMQIIDHGKGIPQNKLKTIFDRFERASSNESIGGLGLGLFIVREIVEGHHGKIEVDSDETGSKFKLTLHKVALAPGISVNTNSANEKHLQ